MFGSDGVALGDEFLVNDTTSGNQSSPQVTTLSDGGFVVTWVDGSSGTQTIRGQRYDAEGTEIGGELLLATPQDLRGEPVVAGLDGGGFALSWSVVFQPEGEQPEDHLAARIFDAAGNPIGDEILVSDPHPEDPTITSLESGGFVVSWVRQSAPGLDIWAQIYDAAGQPVGSGFIVNPTTIYAQNQPSISGLASGGFVATWSDRSANSNVNGYEIKGQIFDATGARVGGEFLVNSTITGDQTRSAVSELDMGGFVVSWTGPVPGDYAVFAQAFDAGGAKIGSEIRVNAAYNAEPTITALESGSFVVSWQEGGDIRAQIFAPVNEYVGTAMADTFVAPSNEIWQVYGLGGDDSLTTGGGADLIDGGTGADNMAGGAGNDTYIVDNAGDVVLELDREGVDSVESSVSFVLSDNVEKLTLTGTDAINGTGHVFKNILIGNSAANVLDGRGGDDTMIGGGGNDTYVVNAIGDVVTEMRGSGHDIVQSSRTYTLGLYLEDLQLTGTGSTNGTGNDASNGISGTRGNNILNGLGGQDRIYGKVGHDVLNGGTGNDDLFGGLGNDRFMFDTALNETTNVDRIHDFDVAVDDLIYLDRTIFGAIPANGTLAASAFRAGTVATEADDRIIYDQSTGRIFYDADGSGAGEAVLFARVNGGTALTNLDFTVYG